MGANSKMYTGPWHEIEDSLFIDWPPYNQELSISDLAKRLIAKYQMDQNDILIGSSLGGMVALEISNIIGLQRIFLIGSAINPNEISVISKLLMPFASKPIVKLSQLISRMSNDLIQQMYVKSNPDFIVSMSKAILNWHGFMGESETIFRVHGKKDHFISCPDNCEIIDKGGHLIAITHARECVDFIQRHHYQNLAG